MSVLRAFSRKIRQHPTVDLLANRQYRYVWLSAASADLANDLRIIALAWLVLELTDSQFWVGLVVGIGGVPMVLLSPLGGVIADRLDRRRVLIVGRLVPAIFILVAVYLVTSEFAQPWHLVGIVLAMGLSKALSGPAGGALVADLVPQQRLFAASSLTAVAGNAGEIYGPAIAGYLIATQGVDAALFAIGLIYVVSTVLMVRVRTEPRTWPERNSTVLTDLLSGLKYVWETPPIRSLLLLASTPLFASAIVPLMPVYARDVLDAGPSGYGALAASLGLGFFVGSLLTTALGNIPRKGLALIAFGSVWSICMAAFAFSESMPLSMALLFGMGVGGSVSPVLSKALLMTYCRPDMRGRVIGLFTVAWSSVPLGMMFGGAVASFVGNEFALLMGVFIGTPAAVIIYLRSPVLRSG
jgi:MFS family permease